MSSNTLRLKPKVVNIGIRSLGATLEEQGVEVAYVDWKPPAGGDTKMLEILRRLERLKSRSADRES